MTELLKEQKQLAGFRGLGRWVTLLLSSFVAKLQGMVRAFMVWVISAGPMPTHIAFIMDGNRRFADRMHVDRRIGHSHGYDALLGTLKDCFDLHVKIVTLFAFSIDNFQRSPDEVSALMDLMQSKLEILVEKQGLASEYGIRVQVLGDLRLLPEAVRLVAEKAMALTRHNSSLVLNLCVSYTSTHEIVHAIQQTCDKFWAAWIEQRSHPFPNIVNNCVKTASRNGVAANGFHIMAGAKGDCNELTGCNCNHASNEWIKVNDDLLFDANDKEHLSENGFSICEDEMILQKKKLAESKLSGRLTRSYFAPSTDVACSRALRNRGQRRAGVLDIFGSQTQLFDAVSSSDVYLHTESYANEVTGNMKRAKTAAFKDVVNELDHDSDAHEVVDPPTNDVSPSLSCLSNGTASAICWCHLSQFHSCEQAEFDLSSTFGSNKPCHLNDRIVKVVNDYVSEEEIEKNLYTYPCPPPDLLIRTSGETRLSNFLLWQTSFSHLAFCKVLWPEFSFRHLFFIILEYQRAFPILLRKRECYNSEPWRQHQHEKL